MRIEKKEAEIFIFKAKKMAAKLKYHVFYTDTVVDNLAYAMKRYEFYDASVTFYAALYSWLKNGIISPENAYNCAFERHKKIIG